MKAEQFYKCGKLWEYSKHGNPISKLCRICRNPVNLNISSNLVQKNIFLTNLRHEFGRIFFNFLVEMRFLSELTSIKTVEKGSNNQEKAKISLVASHHLELILSCSESLSLFIFLSQKTLVYFKSDHPYQILLLSFFDDSLPCSEKDLSCKLFLFCFTELSRLHYQHMYFSVLVQNSEKKNQRLSPLSLVLVFFVQINFPMFPLQCSPLIVGKGQAGSEEDLSCTKSTAGYLILYFLYL